jgi:transposase
LDDLTGELTRAKLSADPLGVLACPRAFPGQVTTTYEAGPTGFGLARFLLSAGIRCEVAAASKLRRPSGDRVKTDARDALLLARLLRLCEIVSVTIPSVDQEGARDLVRAGEDARGDLMSAQHRTLKFLPRQGIIYSGGTAWTHHRLAAAAALHRPSPPDRLRHGARDCAAHRGPP